MVVLEMSSASAPPSLCFAKCDGSSTGTRERGRERETWSARGRWPWCCRGASLSLSLSLSARLCAAVAQGADTESNNERRGFFGESFSIKCKNCDKWRHNLLEPGDRTFKNPQMIRTCASSSETVRVHCATKHT